MADPSVAISRGVSSCTRVLARARTTPYGGKTWLIRNVAINRPLYSDSRAGTQNPLSGGGENVDNCVCVCETITTGPLIRDKPTVCADCRRPVSIQGCWETTLLAVAVLFKIGVVRSGVEACFSNACLDQVFLQFSPFGFILVLSDP